MRRSLFAVTLLALFVAGTATAEPARHAPRLDAATWIADAVDAALGALSGLAERAAAAAAEYFPKPEPIGGNAQGSEAESFPTIDPVGGDAQGGGGGDPENGEYYPEPDPIG